MNLNFRKVKKDSFGYFLLKFFVDWWLKKIFYKKLTVTGREFVPKNKPVLIGPNHQNALMDPMIIIASRNDDPVFLARSDVFSSKIISEIFLFLKILPVYRIRDGREKLAKNEEIFEVSVEVLQKNKTLVLFPEAQHTSFRSLLQLKKGLMRIAFAAAEKSNFNLDLHIVPAGIVYSNYFNYRTKVLVNYGKPLNINDYKDLYLENQTQAYVKLRNDLRKRMIDLAIHIKNKEFYDVYEDAREIFDFYTAKKLSLNIKKDVDKFKTDKKIIEILDKAHDNSPEKFKEFAENVQNYSKKLKQTRLKDYLFDKKTNFLSLLINTILSIILLPLNFVGFLNFLLPVCSVELLVKKFKDAQFHSSVRFAVTMFSVLIWAIILFFITWALTDVWWIKFAVFGIQPLFFVFWFEYRRNWKKITGKWRFLFNSQTKNELKNLREEIFKFYEIFIEQDKKDSEPALK
jgi:1-acyl-sn-glycerol-3-phosphate acyltransferase